jgi:hypothetical protein
MATLAVGGGGSTGAGVGVGVVGGALVGIGLVGRAREAAGADRVSRARSVGLLVRERGSTLAGGGEVRVTLDSGGRAGAGSTVDCGAAFVWRSAGGGRSSARGRSGVSAAVLDASAVGVGSDRGDAAGVDG